MVSKGLGIHCCTLYTVAAQHNAEILLALAAEQTRMVEVTLLIRVVQVDKSFLFSAVVERTLRVMNITI